MHIFGLNVSLSNNNKYIKQSELYKVIDQLRLEVKNDIGGIHKRIDEIFVILVEKK